MLCLGIESSCDETALALVKDGILVDSILSSQADLHAIFDGVVPELASREHYRLIGSLFDMLMKRNGLSPYNIDTISVARGPGLLGSLLVGVAFAKGLAFALNRPLLGINHLHAHLLANGLEQQPVFPALGLVASGGHSNIYYLKSEDSFEQIGRSVDDAAGETLDKVGSVLHLQYPAGKQMDKLAQSGKADKRCLPRPRLKSDNLNFSFSGIKTAAINYIRSNRLDEECPESSKMANFCASLNLAIVDTLVEKLEKAMGQYPDIKALWLAGGVAANTLLRSAMEGLAKDAGLSFLVPAARHCTDNAAMIAYAGWVLHKKGFSHSLAFEAIARGRKMPDDMLKKTPFN